MAITALTFGHIMILVTGGSGMLGHHLIKMLFEQGKKVRAIYRSPIPAGLQHCAEWVQGDILDVISMETVMQDVQQVYHCAGMVSFSPDKKKELYQINVEGTANVVNACLDAGVQKLVHVSSVAALGKKHGGKTVTEAIQWTEESGNSIYGKTKYLGEMEAFRGMGEGLQIAVVNPTIIIGEWGDWEKGSMAIFKNVYKGFPWYSTGTTGFVDADDVASAMIGLMESSISGQRFIVNAENRTYKDLFFMIADAFGKPRPQKEVTPFLAAIVWRLEKVKSWFSKKEPMVTKETADTALTTVNYDNSKLLKALPGFQYRPLQESVKRICKHLISQQSAIDSQQD